jgi:hypothetical protein
MASRICVVPADWNLEEYGRHSCGDGSHYHIGHSELIEQKQRNLVVYLREGSHRREKTIVQIQELPERDVTWAGRITPSRAIPGKPMNPGLSFRLGEYLAQRVRQRHAWAAVMQAEMRRPESGQRVLAVGPE